jgi:hypothetical protein
MTCWRGSSGHLVADRAAPPSSSPLDAGLGAGGAQLVAAGSALKERVADSRYDPIARLAGKLPRQR